MVNKVILIGNVGLDPEVRTTEGGVKVARVRLATTERLFDRASNETKEHTEWHTITLGALYCFIRLILSIRKKDLFNPSNVFRVRLISATIIVASIIKTLAQYINYDIATHSIQLSGYQVESVQIPWSMFLSALLLAIFAEIYAQAIKLKEEQDLTI